MTTHGIYTEEYPKFSLEFHYDAFPGDPGRTSGPPENCYPPEPDKLEFTEIWLIAGETRIDILALAMLDELSIDFDHITDRIWETLADNSQPDPPEEDFNYSDEEGNRLP